MSTYHKKIEATFLFAKMYNYIQISLTKLHCKTWNFKHTQIHTSHSNFCNTRHNFSRIKIVQE